MTGTTIARLEWPRVVRAGRFARFVGLSLEVERANDFVVEIGGLRVPSIAVGSTRARISRFPQPPGLVAPLTPRALLALVSSFLELDLPRMRTLRLAALAVLLFVASARPGAQGHASPPPIADDDLSCLITGEFTGDTNVDAVVLANGEPVLRESVESPSMASNRGRSVGVEITSTSRMPASISTPSG